MKLFSDSYLNRHDILKKALIGFEFEFYSKHNYPQTLEIFNRELGTLGIKVWGFKQYHSKFKPDEKNFKLEPDLSGGFSMAELVTGPMDYVNARLIMIKCLKILQNIAMTTDRSSIHVNVSFPNDTGKNIEKLNIIKLILNLDESRIYQSFPDREDNVYAKSIKNIIPYKDYDYTNSSASVLTNSLSLPNTKYYGVNFGTILNGRLEYRYLGGENYQNKIGEILELVDYFVMTTWDCIAMPLDESESKMLRTYLDENIRKYKSLSKLENFMSQFPSVELQIDKKNDFEVVNAYYTHLYSDVFEILNNSKELKNCIINYDTETKFVEIIDAEIEFVGPISNYDLIECVLKSGDISFCNLFGCTVIDSILTDCDLFDSEASDSKLLNVKVDEYSEIKNCYYTDGYLNGNMVGGVLRSGKLGPEAQISDDTKVFNNDQNFFNLKGDDNMKKGFDKKKK